MPDRTPNDSTKFLIDWLRDGDDSDYWTAVAREAWESEATGSSVTRMERARTTLAQSLENHIVDSAPEHDGKFCGHLLAHAIEHIDWEAAAGSLLSRVAARVAA